MIFRIRRKWKRPSGMLGEAERMGTG